MWQIVSCNLGCIVFPFLLLAQCGHIVFCATVITDVYHIYITIYIYYYVYICIHIDTQFMCIAISVCIMTESYNAAVVFFCFIQHGCMYMLAVFVVLYLTYPSLIHWVLFQ